MRAAVLMYHTLYRDTAELETIDAEERPYAVHVDEFVRQLDVIDSLGFQVCDPRSMSAAPTGAERRLLISFDDGHVSNYTIAYPELLRRGWSALFLVTTDFMDRRPGFCSWQQLAEMARGGMGIGSHGRTHRFLDALTDTELREELEMSGETISRHTGVHVDSISFPGGRFDRRCLKIGAQLGWRYFLNSRVGDNDPRHLAAGGNLRRIALRNTTRSGNLRTLLEGGWALRRAELTELAKRLVRGVLGNRLYHTLYQRLAA